MHIIIESHSGTLHCTIIIRNNVQDTSQLYGLLIIVAVCKYKRKCKSDVSEHRIQQLSYSSGLVGFVHYCYSTQLFLALQVVEGW